jgi:23S rRNA (cytidine1920-2'-O)/16S rRNA (cytidine1409-2'-O)-methyltransferase
MPARQRQRLDTLLVERGLVESRELARRLIMAGEIRVNGQVQFKPGHRVDATSALDVKATPRFVSRGGEKLDAALEAFSIPVADRICADLGASTGGFTDCLLRRGAQKVYAIDVGYGQLDYRLRMDSRVVVMERTNARHLEALPEPVSLVSVDASFISLRLLLPVVRNWLDPAGASVVALVKPQFEAGRADVGKGGVVKNTEVHARVLREVLGFAADAGYAVAGLIRSPLTGPAGNVEFLVWLAVGGDTPPALFDVEVGIAAVMNVDT